MALPGMAEIFKQKDPPEKLRTVQPPNDPQTIEEHMSDGTVRVLRSNGPGCALVCVEIRKESPSDG